MKRLIPLLVVLGIAGPPALAISFYESPDVPTNLGANTYLPWDIVNDSSGTYALSATLPANAPVDALHRRCDGDWLLSVEAPTLLAGNNYEPRDIIRWDGAGTYSLFFCGGPLGISAGSAVDAAFLDGGDNADLIVSFDVPTTLGGSTYDPADLVRFQPGVGCAGWTAAGLYFDASAASPAVPTSSNVTGADERGGLTVMTFDVPTTLGPTFLPGQLVSWDGAAFASYYAPGAWPISSRTDGFSFLPDPGVIPSLPPLHLRVEKAAGFPPDIELFWNASSSPGVTTYAIYEGNLGAWYTHRCKVYPDTGGDLKEAFTPQVADSYYLVVPVNPNDEGSYGKRTPGVERPRGSPACVPTQGLACP